MIGEFTLVVAVFKDSMIRCALLKSQMELMGSLIDEPADAMLEVYAYTATTKLGNPPKQ